MQQFDSAVTDIEMVDTVFKPLHLSRLKIKLNRIERTCTGDRTEIVLRPRIDLFGRDAADAVDETVQRVRIVELRHTQKVVVDFEGNGLLLPLQIVGTAAYRLP